jgi:hypothetical protein
LYDPENPKKRVQLHSGKTLNIEDKRTTAATRSEYANWYENCKQYIYRKYNITQDFQVWNMDETYIALFVTYFVNAHDI